MPYLIERKLTDTHLLLATKEKNGLHMSHLTITKKNTVTRKKKSGPNSGQS